MLRISIRQGKGGRWRWFAMKDVPQRHPEYGKTAYSSFPQSFASEQQAWEHAEWASGASVTMRWENPNDPNDLFEQHARDRDFTN